MKKKNNNRLNKKKKNQVKNVFRCRQGEQYKKWNDYFPYIPFNDCYWHLKKKKKKKKKKKTVMRLEVVGEIYFFYGLIYGFLVFNDMLTFVGYLMPKLSFLEEQFYLIDS